MATLLSQTSQMPQMRAAFGGWTIPIILTVFIEDVVDGLVRERTRSVKFQGVIQPLSPRMIALKPEGQRAWEWLQIHAITSTKDLAPNDRIEYQGNAYKVMGVNDYSKNNYIEYHVVKDYSRQPGCNND